ncbi:DJ-1/PfpI family protein [Roseospira marina]|nr:DJ-1/PfpI family protein [Roseospira marina]
MKRVLIVTGDFAEDYEVMVPLQALQMLGFVTDLVCPGKQAGAFIKTAVHDFEDDQTYTEKPGHRIRLTGSFVHVEPDAYAGLYLPGGRAPEYLRLNAEVCALARHFVTAARPVAAICHGAQILTAADVVRGRTLTAYPALRPDVEMAGGTFVDVPPDESVLDGALATSPAWPGHPALLRAFVRLLGPPDGERVLS